MKYLESYLNNILLENNQNILSGNEEIKYLIDLISNVDLFKSIGKKNYNSNEVIPARNLKSAIKFFNNNTYKEANDTAWESTRYNIIKQKDKDLENIWTSGFKQINNLVKQAVQRSSKSSEIMESLKVNIDDFIISLPFVGAFGEILIKDKFPTYVYYTNQIPIYKEGHWVCGWSGDLRGNSYPKPTIMGGLYIIY